MAEALIKNHSYLFTVESLCGNGNGVARHDGFVVFIPHSAPGDRLRAKIIKLTKSYAVGKIEEILTPSPQRFQEGCSLQSQCGGCSFQHITYEAECTIKRAMIDDSLSRIAGLPLRVSEYLAAPRHERYRNKVIYPVGRDKNGQLTAGFYAPLSHRLIPHEDCKIGPEIFGKIKKAALEEWEKLKLSVYDETDGTGLLRALYMRMGEKNSVLLTLVINGSTLGNAAEQAFCQELTRRFPELTGILLNSNLKTGNGVLGDSFRTLWGQGYLYDSLCGKRFRIAPGAFWQVNVQQTQRLYETARAMAAVKPGDTLFDLYCGTGTIGIILAEKGVKLVGVEISQAAVKDAAENARANGVEGEFICLDTGEALNSPRLRDRHPDVIVIDPPRKGCGSDAVSRIASFGARRIVYVSCNPQTLARDLVTFAGCGYTAEKAVGVDLFPRTGHVETVVSMSRKEK